MLINDYEKSIFLTFDLDWAIDDVIRDTIDILRSEKVKATVFVTHDSETSQLFYYQHTTSVGYHRDNRRVGDREIDIVVDFPRGRILIEVKYKEKVLIGENDAIYEWADSASSSIVVTKRDNDFGLQQSKGKNKILRLPAFAFLYILSNAEKHGYRGVK